MQVRPYCLITYHQRTDIRTVAIAKVGSLWLSDVRYIYRVMDQMEIAGASHVRQIRDVSCIVIPATRTDWSHSA